MMLTVSLESDGGWENMGTGQDGGFWNSGNVLSLDLSAGYMNEFIWQNSCDLCKLLDAIHQ